MPNLPWAKRTFALLAAATLAFGACAGSATPLPSDLSMYPLIFPPCADVWR